MSALARPPSDPLSLFFAVVLKKQYLRDGRAPVPKNERTSRVMSLIGAKNTKPELIFRKALWRVGLRGYRLHFKKVPGRPDIAFTSRSLAVFVNGCFWHRCPYCQPAEPKSNSEFWRDKFSKNVARDKRKAKELRALGWSVITVWECQLKKDLKAQVKKVVARHNKLSSR